MIKNKTKIFLLLSIIFVAMVGISAISAADDTSTVNIVEESTSNDASDIPATIDNNEDNINIQNSYNQSDSEVYTDNSVKSLEKEKKHIKEYRGQPVATLSTSKSEYNIGENVPVTLKLTVDGYTSYDFGYIYHGEVKVKLGSTNNYIYIEGDGGVNPTYTTTFNTNSLSPGSYNINIENIDIACDPMEFSLSDCQTNTVTITLVSQASEPSNIAVDGVTFTTTQNAVLAYNDTNVTVALSNDGGACQRANITLNIDGESKTKSITNLDDTPQNVIFEYYFTTPGTKDITVIVDYLNGTSFTAYTGTVNVIASGYMGKSFTNNTNMTNAVTYEGYNTLNIYGNLFNYKSNQAVSFTFDTTEKGITDSDKIIDILYYQPWGVWNGQTANITVQLNDESLEPIASYSDKKGFGGYDFPYGLYVYNITDYILTDDINTFNIAPVSGSQGYAYFYGGYIVSIYQNSTKRSIITIAEDCDALSAGTSSSYGATPETAITYANFDGFALSDISSAQLTVMANNANNQEFLYMNDVQKAQLSNSYNSSSQVAIATVDVTEDITRDNVVSVKCVQDTSVYVLTSILAVEYNEAVEQPNVAVDSITFTKTQNKVIAYNDTNVSVVVSNDGGLCQEADIIITIGDESKTQRVYNLDTTPQTLVYDYYFTIPGQKTVTVTVDYLNGTTETIYTGSVTVSMYYTTVSSETLTTKASGTVTGGLYHNAIQNPAFNSGFGKYTSNIPFTFVDPEESYSDIATARLYAVLYDTRDSGEYFINVTVDGDNDGEYETVLENNHYIAVATTPDSTVYKLNDNITKVYTDYVLFYDITDDINSETIKVKIDSSRGAIKCIGLIVAYNQDNSNKEVDYWINLGSAWSNSNNIVSNFATRGKTADDVNLTQSITSSTNPTSKFNDHTITYSKNPSGYFGIESWNVTEYYDSTKNSVLANTPQGSFKTQAATLALTTIHEVEPNLAVDGVTFTTTQNAVLAYNDTNVTVTVSNDGGLCQEANITITIDDESKTKTIANLEDVPQNVIFEYYFTTPGTKDITVIVDYLNGTSFTAYTGTVNVIASGYMGKSFTNNTNMTNTATYEGYNTLNIYGNLFNYKSNQAVSFTFDTTEKGITDSDKIIDILYYQPWGVWNGQTANITVQLNDESLEPIASYSDKKGFGGYDFPYGLYVYNITDYILTDDINTFNIAPVSGSQGYAYFYGGYIVSIYQNSTKRSIITIAEDCDALSAGTSSSYGATPETAITYANYNNLDTTNLTNAYLTVMANNANNQEYLYINDVQKAKLSDSYNTGSQVAIATADVTDDITTDNTVAIKCVQDTSVYVLTSILTVEYEEMPLDITVDSVKVTTYSGSLLALESNTIEVNLTSNKDGSDAFEVTLSIGDEYESTQSVESYTSGDMISISFDDYVPSSNGDKSITVSIDYLNGTVETLYSDDVTVYYNGYMGKSFTEGTNLSNVAVYEGFNTVNVYQISDYVSSGWSDLSYSFNLEDYNINLDDMVEVLYYQAYTYSKGLDINVIVNGESFNTIASYVDQKGFGTYNYPYGLLVYNITDVIQDNNIINLIAGDSNNNGLYGGYLIIISNNATTYNKIIISEDCDMLSTTSSSYGATSQTAISYANYNTITDDVTSASIIVIAAGADNTVNVLFNDDNLGSLGDNYNSSSQLSVFKDDISTLSQDNTLAVQSINDNLYVFNSILTYSFLLDSDVEIDDITAKVDDTINITARVVDKDNNPINVGTVVFNDANGTVLGESEVIDGEASIEVVFDKKLSTTITATFNSEAYATSSDDALLTIDKGDTVVTIEPINASVNDVINLVAHVDNQNGNPVNGGKVVFKVNGITIKDENGKVIYAVVENGVATITDYTIPSSWLNKNISINAVYSGSVKYESAKANTTATITQATPTMSLDINQTTATINDTVKFTVKVSLDADGNVPVSVGKVIFKINGKTVKDADGKVIYLNVDENGTATYDYNIGNLKAKTYNITAVYTSTYYNRIETNEVLTITT